MNRVMVVEDERYLLELYRSELEDSGYKVIGVASGSEVLDKIKLENPDVIVLDIRLEGIEGLEVLEQIKNYNVDLPVILNSAYSTYKANFSSWIADDYVVKSPDLTELKMVIGKYAKPNNSLQETTA
jgi:DNA-binding response OmpR family regulator